MLISELTEQYLQARQARKGERTERRNFAAALARIGIVDAAELDHQTLNRAIRTWTRENKRTPATMKRYRVMVCDLAQFAHALGIAPPCQRRNVRSVGSRKRTVEPWSLEQARQLLAATESLAGNHRTGIPRAAYWSSYIRAAWDSSAPPDVLLPLEPRWIRADGRCVSLSVDSCFAFVLRPTTLEAIRRTFPPERDRVWPVSSGRKAWFGQAKIIIAKAGLTGSLGQLLHPSGTTVKIQSGHSEALDPIQTLEDHYPSAPGFAHAIFPAPEL